MWLDDNFFVVAFSDIYNGSKGKLVIGKRKSIDPVGIAKESGVANDPIQVAVGGSVDWLTGLVAGKTYYGTISGQLTTVNTGCKIGRAISATELVLNIDY